MEHKKIYNALKDLKKEMDSYLKKFNVRDDFSLNLLTDIW